MLRAIRRVLPISYLGWVLITYGTMKAIELFFRFGLGVDPDHLPPTGGDGGLQFTQVCELTFLVLVGSSFFYGVSRACRIHPGSDVWFGKKQRNGFATYLRSTPWNPSKRLPWGSPMLSWVDGIVVGGIAGLAIFEIPNSMTIAQGLAVIVAACAAGYGLIPICYEQTRRGHWFGLAAVFLIPLLLITAPMSALTLLLSATILGLAHFATRESLIAFPLIDGEKQSRKRLGWPFDSLSPHDESKWFKATKNWKLVLWSGWLTIIVLAAFEIYGGERSDDDLMAFVLFSGGIATLIRLCTYSCGVRISFLTRLRTGRWLVPETDRMFVPSLMIALLTAAFAGMIWNGVPGKYLITPFVTAVMASATLIGPTPHQWRLTCRGILRPNRGVGFKKQPTPAA